ncbi:MAG: hypothetical protein PHW32_03970 [Bacilli bacterium]|nr:hypothetical protein [Bacilli bacterium]MDD4282794.1 hypothetical protein [Bacilli bacterium]MDD4719153.1 hypothetical protein [Bacilli bacterium]
MNNKGQTLVVFILLLPLIVLLLTFVINEGYVYIAKRAFTNDIKEAINYRFQLEETDEIIYDKVYNYIYKNVKNISSLDINLSDNYIKITASVKVKAELPMIIKKDSFQITVSYTGHIFDEEVVIIKE